jgi:hypothetical protein
VPTSPTGTNNRPRCTRCGYRCAHPWVGTKEDPRPNPPDPWLAKVDTLTQVCAHLWPEHCDSLDHIRTLAAQLTHDWHLADPLTHDGIRSPNLEPSGHGIGGHSDPVFAAVAAMDDNDRQRVVIRDGEVTVVSHITAGPWTIQRKREAARSLVMVALVSMSRADDAERAHRNVDAALSNLQRAVGRTQQVITDAMRSVRNGLGGKPDRTACTSCARVKDHRGDPLYIDASRKASGRNGLCHWCDGFRAEHNRLPPIHTLERKHLHGETITVAKVTRDLADERAAERKRNQRKRGRAKAS